MAHAARAGDLTAGHRARRARGERHAIEDFLFEYYPAKPAMLRRWHPGVGVSLAPRAAWGAAHARVVGHGSVAISGSDVSHGPAAKAGSELSGGSVATGGSDVLEGSIATCGPDASCGSAVSRTPDVAEASGEGASAPHTTWRWYRTEPDGTVSLDVPGFLTDRGDTIRYVHGLLSSTAARPAATGCFGLHEWAMVYRQRDGEHRHPRPLRLGGAGTDAVVETHKIRCTHIDAFRFFTPEAASRNTLEPTRETQVAMEQPGCLHANMDLVMGLTCSRLGVVTSTNTS